MAAVISGITLFREKSTVCRFAFGGQNPDTVFQVCSNRVSLQLRVGHIKESVVVRGQNIASTLRLAAIVLDQFARFPTLFGEHGHPPVKWGDLWNQRLSTYEKTFQPESWVSLHHQGETIHTTHPLQPPSSTIEEIERIARGDDVTDSTIRQAAAHFLDEDTDLITQHESQTAVVVSPFKEYYRAAILERREGRTGSFAIAVHHPQKVKKRIRYAGFINFCADTIEASTLHLFLDRVKHVVEENHLSALDITPAQVAGAIERKRDLTRFIATQERANKITYRPERPDFL